MLRDILLLQRRELEQRLQERYVERDIGRKEISHDLIKVILGPRRAGKSFFAMHFAKDLDRFGYINFDDERLVAIGDPDSLIASVDAIYKQPRYLLLDEVQNLPGWELLVNRLQRQGYNLIITGSNAHLLSSELATHLTGRHIPIVLFPFSFPEYLRSLNRQLTEQETGEAFRNYAEMGGYPEPLIKGISNRDYLITLLRSILYKDIVVRHRIRAPQGLQDLADYLLSNSAQRYSLNNLKDVTRLQSPHTVEKYLLHLAEAFLFFYVRRFSFKFRNQIRSSRKVYCTDNGMITSASFRFSSNIGRLYENIVAIELQKRSLLGDIDFYYWQSPQQEEVDFVVKKGTKVEHLIQVCFNINDSKTKSREIRSLLKASEQLNCKKLLILTDSLEGQETATWYGKQGAIRYLPVWKWLLKEKSQC